MLLTLFLSAPPALASQVAAVEGANIQRPAWSPAGDMLAYEANYHDRKVIELYVGGLEGEATRITPPTRASTSLTQGFAKRETARVVHELAWGPPGVDRYVYAASNDASDYDLFVQGGGALAAAPGADGGAAWSPDGRWIAFTSARTGEGDLYLLDVHAIEKPPRRVTRDPSSSELYATWAPDSLRLVYVGHSNTGDNLWVLPALDGRATKLTSWSGNQIRPTFAPTGSDVAFYANHEEPTRFDLYVISATTGATPRLLARGVVPDASGPSWSPDGAHIVFVEDADDAYDPIAAVRVATGAIRRLAFDTVGHGDLDVVQREGALWVAYVAQGRQGDIQRDFKRLFAAPLQGLP